MGEGSQGAAATRRLSEIGIFCSYQAHDVGGGAQENRSVSASAVGKGEGGAEEGGVAGSIKTLSHLSRNRSFASYYFLALFVSRAFATKALNRASL